MKKFISKCDDYVNKFRYNKKTYMKKPLKFNLLCFSSFLILLTSCTNNSLEQKNNSADYDSIKRLLNNRIENTLWTEELEAGRLENKKNEVPDIFSDSIHFGKDTAKFIPKDALYPYIEDFTSLDISDYTEQQLNKINEFCEALCKNFYGVSQNLFDEKYFFTYVFFMQYVIENWSSHFNCDFPIALEEYKEYKEKLDAYNAEQERLEKEAQEATETAELEGSELAEQQAETADTENEKVLEESQKTESAPIERPQELPKVFDSYLIGSPFEYNQFIQIPVRFICKNRYIDIQLFYKTKENNIFNIDIINWGGLG